MEIPRLPIKHGFEDERKGLLAGISTISGPTGSSINQISTQYTAKAKLPANTANELMSDSGSS